MNKLISAGKITGVLIIILGLIHDIATFTPLIQDGLECLSTGNFNAMTYMSLICGTSLILSGSLIIILLNKVKEFTWLNFPILLISCFLLLNGILSVLYMSNNPFAWLTFLLCSVMFLITLLLRKGGRN